MAAVNPTISILDGNDKSVILVTWNGLNNNDRTGAPVQFVRHADRSVQFNGTFNTATVVLQGSNDDSTYFTLTDPQGNLISSNAALGESVTELTRSTRPRISGGGGAENVVVTLLMKMQNPVRT
jgi:hypothetical protein